MTHEVTVRRESVFPKCRKCGFDVRFELVRLTDTSTSVAEQPLTGMLVPFDHEQDEADAASA
jgi:hypothetical protein